MSWTKEDEIPRTKWMPKEWLDFELLNLDKELDNYREEYISPKGEKKRGLLLSGMTRFLKDKGALTKYSTDDNWVVLFPYEERLDTSKGYMVTVQTGPDKYGNYMKGINLVTNKGQLQDLKSLDKQSLVEHTRVNIEF